MIDLDEPQGPRYVGLLPDVKYRVELGFAFVDDGDHLKKMSLLLFEQAIGVRPVERERLAPVVDLVRAHPTVFGLFSTAEEAERSLVEKEV